MVHTFHIPVMGLAFTIDTPIKIAHLGISSVVSIGDDYLTEKARNYYAAKYSIPYVALDRKDKDARASVTTSYLNVIQEIVQIKWQEHIQQLVSDATYRAEFFSQVAEPAYWEQQWAEKEAILSQADLISWAKEQFKPGQIDVNIMTKLDKKNVLGGEELPIEYNDAHAVLRGFAKSNLSSSVVLSAGMNTSLFAYMKEFSDFFPDTNGNIKKRITIKVSDYRSAYVQGKMLAKKGLWVSEFRIESGLNCGGHTFATQGYLMGPIMEEIKQKRNEMYQELYGMWKDALQAENKWNNAAMPEQRISVQGGVGTHQEHEFLRKYYGVNSVGWGSPFLLVPEAVSIDDETMHQLAKAKEDDLYLSNASPLGVRFNNLRNTSRQLFQKSKTEEGKLGNPCTKKFLQLNTEFAGSPICTASTKYIHQAIQKLKDSLMPEAEIEQEKTKMLEKECLCSGLAMPFLEENNLDKKLEVQGVSVCPGPNIAYFDRILTLSEMLKHIYGRVNVITRTDRPNMFIKEIQLYMDFLSEKVTALKAQPNDKAKQYVDQFIQNMKDGIEYYDTLFRTELASINIKQNIEQKLAEFMLALEQKQLAVTESLVLTA